MEKEEVEILLKEYEICQSHADSSTTHYWLSAGIFIGINTAILGVLASNIITSSATQTLNKYSPYLVLAIGLSIILIIISLLNWLNRTVFFVRINYAIMREIEEKLGMTRLQTIYWIENPNKVPKEQKTRIEEMRRLYPPHMRGVQSITITFSIISLLWIFIIVMAFIIK